MYHRFLLSEYSKFWRRYEVRKGIRHCNLAHEFWAGQGQSPHSSFLVFKSSQIWRNRDFWCFTLKLVFSCKSLLALIIKSLTGIKNAPESTCLWTKRKELARHYRECQTLETTSECRKWVQSIVSLLTVQFPRLCRAKWACQNRSQERASRERWVQVFGLLESILRAMQITGTMLPLWVG